MRETFREIQQDRLDREHRDAAPPGCVAYLSQVVERDAMQMEIDRLESGQAPVLLGYIGLGMTEARWAEVRDEIIAASAARDAARDRGERVSERLRGMPEGKR